MYIPAIPLVKESFGVGDAAAQLTFSITLFVMAFATLAYGSLSDLFGRKPVLIGGLTLFLAGTLACLFAPDIETLVAGRFLQATGAACGVTLARAIARDLYNDETLVKALAYLTMAYVMGPMIAPVIGGHLIDWLDWGAVFAFAILAGEVILILSVFVLYETNPAVGQPVTTRPSLIGSYIKLFRSARFCGFVFQSGLATGAFFTLASQSGILMRDLLGRSSGEFGFYFIGLAVSYWIGNLIASRLSGQVRIETMVFVGAAVMVGSGVLLALFVGADIILPITLIGPGYLLGLGQGMALANAQTGAMSIDRDLAGTASGVGFFMQMFMGAAFSQLAGLFADGTPWPMTVLVGIATVLGLAAALVPYLTRDRAPGAI